MLCSIVISPLSAVAASRFGCMQRVGRLSEEEDWSDIKDANWFRSRSIPQVLRLFLCSVPKLQLLENAEVIDLKA